MSDYIGNILMSYPVDTSSYPWRKITQAGWQIKFLAEPEYKAIPFTLPPVRPDHIWLQSPACVDYFIPYLPAHWLDGIQIHAWDDRTAERLRAYAVDTSYNARGHRTALVDWVKQYPEGSILLPRAQDDDRRIIYTLPAYRSIAECICLDIDYPQDSSCDPHSVLVARDIRETRRMIDRIDPQRRHIALRPETASWLMNRGFQKIYLISCADADLVSIKIYNLLCTRASPTYG